MSTVLAHEINNPLETIQNALYLIRTSDGVLADAANLTKTAVDEVICEIEFSRSTRSFFRRGSEPEKINLSIVPDSVGPTHPEARNCAGNKQHQDPVIEGLPDEICQVLLNLLRNACETTAGTSGRMRATFTG